MGIGSGIYYDAVNFAITFLDFVHKVPLVI